MEYRVANINDLTDVSRLGMLLWPDDELVNLTSDFEDIINSDRERVYVAVSKDEIVAFAHFAIRTDYVNGSSSSPTGYLEGIYVMPENRNAGVAKTLIRYGEKWSKLKGCSEMGSDVLFDNTESMKFHEKMGFKEEERVVCYIKPINKEK